MNFDEAFKHYRDGVATEEEKQFVKEQLAKANEFLQNESVREESPFKEADAEDVKKAKKKTFKKIWLFWEEPVFPMKSLVQR